MISGESLPSLRQETANRSKTAALLSEECDADTTDNHTDQLRSQALQVRLLERDFAHFRRTRTGPLETPACTYFQVLGSPR